MTRAAFTHVGREGSDPFADSAIMDACSSLARFGRTGGGGQLNCDAFSSTR